MTVFFDARSFLCKFQFIALLNEPDTEGTQLPTAECQYLPFFRKQRCFLAQTLSIINSGEKPEEIREKYREKLLCNLP